MKRVLNSKLIKDIREGYISSEGKWGRENHYLKIVKRRPINSILIGKVGYVQLTKTWFAQKQDNKCIGEEYETKEDAKNALKENTIYRLDFTETQNDHFCIKNFLDTRQIFMSLESEAKCGENTRLEEMVCIPHTLLNKFEKYNIHSIKHLNRNDNNFDLNQNLRMISKSKRHIDCLLDKCDQIRKRSKILNECNRNGNGNRKRGLFESRNPNASIIDTNGKSVPIDNTYVCLRRGCYVCLFVCLICLSL